jgi:hypothetical protein
VLLTLIERKPTLPQPPKPQLVIRESSRAV